MYITLKKMDKMAELFGIAFRKIFCLMVRITKENLMYIVGFYKKKYLNQLILFAVNLPATSNQLACFSVYSYIRHAKILKLHTILLTRKEKNKISYMKYSPVQLCFLKIAFKICFQRTKGKLTNTVLSMVFIFLYWKQKTVSKNHFDVLSKHIVFINNYLKAHLVQHFCSVFCFCGFNNRKQFLNRNHIMIKVCFLQYLHVHIYGQN